MRRTSVAVGCAVILSLSCVSRALAEPVRVACIGDSITFAAIEPFDRAKAYPVQLQELLGDDYDVRNFGVSGATMSRQGDRPYWETDAFAETQKFAPDIALVMLGTNDSKPQNWDAAAYEAAYREMLAVLAGLPSKPTVILCRPTPAFSDAFGIRNSVIVEEIIPIVDHLATEFGLHVIDFYGQMREYGGVFPDGIHPNATGSRMMAEQAAQKVREVAGQKTDRVASESKPFQETRFCYEV